MNDHSAGHTELPRTAYLDHTLRRARTAAEQRSHRYVTLEHLLLALLDDPDALKLLKTVGADVAVIQTAVAGAVNNRMSTLVDPTGRPPSFSYKFDSLFPGAAEDAMRAGRREICGALALIAIAKDPDSYASAILAANGFNPQAALNALASIPSSPGQPLQPATVPLAPPPPFSHAEMAPRPKQEPPARPPQTAAAPYPAPVAQSTREDTGENLMEDMLASVRNILDAEERKERGLPLVSSPSAMPPPAPRGSPPRLEPQLRADAAPDRLRSCATRPLMEAKSASIPLSGPRHSPVLPLCLQNAVPRTLTTQQASPSHPPRPRIMKLRTRRRLRKRNEELPPRKGRDAAVVNRQASWRRCLKASRAKRASRARKLYRSG